MITTTALTRSRLLIAVLLLALGTVGLSTTATAATSPDASPTDTTTATMPAATTTTDTTTPTTTTADASTLSARQQARLERRVQRVLDRTDGGERTAANEITWAEDGVVLTLPVPGEMQAAGDNCIYKYVCLYAARGYEGWRIEFVNCGLRRLGKYGFGNITSSWINRQTSGTRSTLYYLNAYNMLRPLTSKRAFYAESFPRGSWKDNKADYIRVC